MLATPFEADLRDTWVRTGPAEQQEVRWLFVSPTGARHTTKATYTGDHRWHVEFVPDEVGPWRYRWTQSFIEEPYVSAIGKFDVIGGDLETVLAGLERLIADLETSPELDGESLERWRLHFQRLEREGLRHLSPTSFRAADGKELLDLLTTVRELISGRPVPDTIPLVPPPRGRALRGRSPTRSPSDISRRFCGLWKRPGSRF